MAKRKHTFLDDQPGEQHAQQQSLKIFGSISKSTNTNGGMKKTKRTHIRELTPPLSATDSIRPDKKRKRVLDPVEEDSEDIRAEACAGQGISAPCEKRTKIIQPPSPGETPTKSAVALLDNLKLETRSQAIPFALKTFPQPHYTPSATHHADSSISEPVTKALEEFTLLHAAFLSALSLYYSHNGATSPVNVKALLPMITKHWKKRAVSLDDLRALIALGGEDESSFELKDFGRVGICLTKQQPRGRATQRATSFVDEKALNSRFQNALQKRWTKWMASTAKENRDGTKFLCQLPLLEIKKDASVEKAGPLFVRGQQRLADLKASQTAAKAEIATPLEINVQQRTAQAVQSRGISLLDRIVAKQAVTASLPGGPTRQQLERKAALYRVEEIARVLELLAGGRPRCSFSLQAIVQQIQQSLRNPISREEVMRCLGLMAKEITPGYITLVQSGTVTGVVLTKGSKPELEDLRQRVQSADA